MSLPVIPFADIRGGSSLDLLKRFPDTARALARSAVSTFGFVSRAAGAVALPLGDRASRRWLEETDNTYRKEIDALAHYLGIRGVYFLNICFEWGCTSGVWRDASGPTMHRVLDWPFPHLGTFMVVAQQSGPAGDFYNMTWPGLAGSFQGLAPGRFAAAVNQAPMRMHRRGYAGDWIKNRRVWRGGKGMPAAHLLREVFETAPDYATARVRLSETRLAVPAIFILSGPRDGEGCIIERSEEEAATRPLADSASVCVANHFESRLAQHGHGWRPRPIDSHGRAAAARNLGERELAEEFGWFRPPIANAHSRLAFNANAATGHLALIGTDGAIPATQVFRLPAN
ncbi:MAG: hypothetical protein JO348_09640 [Alphaproteobacteria bacterium]|nr:hypothetical protein [Alphaproteobacteria bacterium]